MLTEMKYNDRDLRLYKDTMNNKIHKIVQNNVVLHYSLFWPVDHRGLNLYTYIYTYIK